MGLIINYRRSRMQDLANLDLLLPLVQYGVPMIQLTPAYNPTSQMTHSTMNHAQPMPHP